MNTKEIREKGITSKMLDFYCTFCQQGYSINTEKYDQYYHYTCENCGHDLSLVLSEEEKHDIKRHRKKIAIKTLKKIFEWVIVVGAAIILFGLIGLLRMPYDEKIGAVGFMMFFVGILVLPFIYEYEK